MGDDSQIMDEAARLAEELGFSEVEPPELEEFIARDPEDFVAKGVRWAHDLPALAGVRAGLRHRWQAAPARNAGFFAAGMELALRRMWQRWCAGLPAQSFAISAEEAASAAAQ